MSKTVATLLQFWVAQADNAVRYEVSIGGGKIEQGIVQLVEPCADTEHRPWVGLDCPDEIREDLADLAWAALNGNCPDARWAGEDKNFDAALDAVVADYKARNAEAA
jgi:hypothetical protein